MNEQQPLSKPLFHVVFIIALLVCLLAVALTITVGVIGFSGIDGGHPIVITLCTNTYWLVKFLDIQKILETAFIHLILSTVCSIIVLVMLISLVLKLKNLEPVTIRDKIKVLLYIFASLTVYFAVVPGAYYLTFQIQIDNCTATYDTTKLRAIAFCGIILVGLALIVWILLLCIYDKTTDPSQKYRQVVNSQTQPNQQRPYQQQRRVKEQYNYVEEDRKYKDNTKKEHEATNQNLYDSPSKKAIVYSKQPQSRNEDVHNIHASHLQHSQYQSKNKSNANNQQKDSRYLQPTQSRFKNSQRGYQKQQRGYQKQQRSPNRNIPQRGYQKHDKSQNQGLVYQKQSRSPERSKYMESLLQQSKGYLNKHGKQSVLDSEGQIQERQSRGSDYGRSSNTNNRRANRSPQREGVLLNYIRGKYQG